MRVRNYSIDLLKGIAAIFVVLIHVQFPGVFGEYIAKIGTFAVPVFFMVSGYFAYNATRMKLRKSIVHILELILIAYVINLVRIFVSQSFSVAATFEVLKRSTFNLDHLIRWLVLNETSISGVAWFLFALLYCYLFCFVFNKWFRSGYIYIVLVLGFFGGLFAQIGLPLLGYGSMGVNNFWLCGIPYFLTGVLIKDKWAILEEKIKVLPSVIIAFLGFAVISAGYVLQSGIWYIGDVLLAVSLFCICAKYPGTNVKFLCKIGNDYAFFIYIMHAIFMHIIDSFYCVGTNVLIDWTRPIIVFAATWISAAAFTKIRQMIKGVKCKPQENTVS